MIMVRLQKTSAVKRRDSPLLQTKCLLSSASAVTKPPNASSNVLALLKLPPYFSRVRKSAPFYARNVDASRSPDVHSPIVELFLLSAQAKATSDGDFGGFLLHFP